MMLRLASLATLLVAALLATHPARAQPTGSVAVPHAAAPSSEVPPACAAPADLTASDTGLPHVAAALKPGKELNILAVGSATMLGPAGGAEGSFPFRMAAYLRAAVPDATVRLTVRSGRGLTAADMLATIRTELSQHPAQLVLWQTGTVEAVRNLPPEDFLQTLSEGAKLAEGGQADLVLIDPQFSRFLHANANLDPYEQTLEQATGLPDVILFHRYELMRHWVSAGQIDLERTVRSDRQKTAALLHDCLGRALAQVILAGAALHSP